jgi:hypothetical protein
MKLAQGRAEERVPEATPAPPRPDAQRFDPTKRRVTQALGKDEDETR